MNIKLPSTTLPVPTFKSRFVLQINNWCSSWLRRRGYLPLAYVVFKKEVYAVTDVVAYAHGVTFTFEK